MTAGPKGWSTVCSKGGGPKRSFGYHSSASDAGTRPDVGKEAVVGRWSSQDSFIPRPRLLGLLDEGAGRRLTLLVSGAGTGKTVLLTQWLEEQNAAWHTATPADASLTGLARGILGRLRLQVPALTSDLFAAVEGMAGPDSGETDRPEAVAAAAAQELETRMSRDVLLVIDDLHHIPPESEGARFLGALLRHAPDQLRFVVSSRHTPPFALARMRFEGGVTELDSSQLAFTLIEAGELFGLDPETSDKTHLRELLEWTGGWATALAFAERLRSRTGNLPHSPAEMARDGSLFDYLAEEVVATEPGERITALEMAAELPWFDRGLLEAVGIPPGILELERPLIYLERQPDISGAASVSPLLADYLRERSSLTPEARSALLDRASRWYQSKGAGSEALDTACRSEDPGIVNRLIAEEGDSLLAAGLAAPLVAAIESLPERAESVLLLEAEARQVLGDWEGATACYDKLAASPGPLPAAVAWRLGFLHHMRGDLTSAMEAYRRGTVGGSDPTNEASLLGWKASACWLRGERDEAKELADRALALAQRAESSRALATAHTVLAMVAALDGDRAANDAHYLRALDHAERARDLVQAARIRSNRSSHFLEEGSLQAAMDEIDLALRLAEMTGFELWRAMALSNRAQVLHLKGRLDEALADLQQARLIFRRLGSSLEAYPLAMQGDVYATRGDTPLASLAYERAISMAEDASDQQVLVPALAGLASIVLHEDLERAEGLASAAGQKGKVLGRVLALLIKTRVLIAQQRFEEALEMAVRAGEMARARHDLPDLAEALRLEALASGDQERALRLLDQARGLWKEMGSPIGAARVDIDRSRITAGRAGATLAVATAKRLRKLGAKGLAIEADRLAERLSDVTTTVEIRTMGGLEVVVGGLAVTTAAWQSRVAREILAMLIASRGRAVHREVLMDRLWPGDPPAKAANRLSVALTTIRSVLDPEKRYPSNHFVTTERDWVGLRKENISIDVEAFFGDSKTGQKFLARRESDEAVAALESAESLYVGDFLVEFPYSDWAVSLREEAKAEFMKVCRLLAEHDIARGEPDDAARRYLRMVEIDPFSEEANTELISAMRAAGHNGTARRLYAIYTERLRELDLEPAPYSDISVPRGR